MYFRFTTYSKEKSIRMSKNLKVTHIHKYTFGAVSIDYTV